MNFQQFEDLKFHFFSGGPCSRIPLKPLQSVHRPTQLSVSAVLHICLLFCFPRVFNSLIANLVSRAFWVFFKMVPRRPWGRGCAHTGLVSSLATFVPVSCNTLFFLRTRKILFSVNVLNLRAISASKCSHFVLICAICL